LLFFGRLGEMPGIIWFSKPKKFHLTFKPDGRNTPRIG
jgi:hypothetical protein